MAEVLITLGIIGVVAVLTIPGLIAKHQEKVNITKVNAAYSILSQAVRQMVENEGTIDGFGNTKEERISKFESLLPKYIQIIKTCPKTKSGCFPDVIFDRFTDRRHAGTSSESKTYMLKNGIGLKMLTQNGNCNKDMRIDGINGTYGADCGEIIIDINGPAGPNKSDVDVFGFKILTDGIVPKGSSKESVWTDSFDAQCTGNHDRKGNSIGICSAWVIYNKNMDYLHCPDKLGWHKASGCK